MNYPPYWGPQGPYNPWCPPPTPAYTPPSATGDHIKDLKKAIKFYTKMQKKQKRESDKPPPKKASWKERVDMYILLAIATPVIIPLYSILVHRLWELAK